MPPAARLNDPATHMMKPITPGVASMDVEIGYMKAWRALPTGMGGGVESALNTMKELIDAASLDPMTTPVKLAKVNAGLTQDAGKAASNGAPAAPAGVSSGFGTLMTANTALTTAYASAAAVPGGEPAARAAYTQAIKAAAAAFAAAAIAAIAGMTDTHVCPQPSGPIPHGPGVVTKGSKSVWINNLPACREGDQVFEAAGGPDPIKVGCQTVFIGDDGGSPAPMQDTSADDEAIQQQTQARSAIAALAQAAAAGTPLIEVCPQCARLSRAAQKTKHMVAFRVVEDHSGEPIAGVTLKVTLPDRTQRSQTTEFDGTVKILDLDAPGMCSVTSPLDNAAIDYCYDFVIMGDTPSPASNEEPNPPAYGGGQPRPGGRYVAKIETHRVRTGETLQSLAAQSGQTWQQLARFNWQTDVPSRVNEHLHADVGCTKKSADGCNYRFDDSDQPGIIYIPQTWEQTGLATDLEHVIRVRRLGPIPRFRFSI